MAVQKTAASSRIADILHRRIDIAGENSAKAASVADVDDMAASSGRTANDAGDGPSGGDSVFVYKH